MGALVSPVATWARGDTQWVQVFRRRLEPMVVRC